MIKDRRKKEIDKMLNVHVNTASKLFFEVMKKKGIDRVPDDEHE